jgi:hypothetical protein
MIPPSSMRATPPLAHAVVATPASELIDWVLREPEHLAGWRRADR